MCGAPKTQEVTQKTELDPALRLTGEVALDSFCGRETLFSCVDVVVHRSVLST